MSNSDGAKSRVQTSPAAQVIRIPEYSRPFGKNIQAPIPRHAELRIPQCIWLTGLSGAGKTSIAGALRDQLSARGQSVYLLDGDSLRNGLNSDLGFTDTDRIENIRRLAEVARLLADAGFTVLVASISPFITGREMARQRFRKGEFIEVFVDTPLEVCQRRDPKGLYAKARRGELENMTGVDSRYEPPHRPEVRVDTSNMALDLCVQTILQACVEKHGKWPALGEP